MRHQGVAFPPEYEPRGLEIRIKDRIVQLNPLQEEMLMAWAKKIGTPYVQDPVFQRNFLGSLREIAEHEHWNETFADVTLADIDFSTLFEIADREKLANMPEEQRKQVSAERKKVRDELKAQYGHATVDDIEVDVGAYLVEPPGIFMGRGAHPLRGKWKGRVHSTDVTLNLDEEAPIPPAPHGEWGAIVHEHDGLWIARWKDELSDKIKYVWLAETSHLRQEREKEKYEKARRLARSLKTVRQHIQRGMRDKDLHTRKVATVAELINTLAMRVGDEKDEDEADTVGASTLRVEHVRFFDDHIEFDFLGKDSVRWEKELPLNDETRQLIKNLQEFATGKQPDEQIFPEIASSQVNRFLGKAMKGLTAKVFRTFHATTTVKGFLKQHNRLNDEPAYEKEFIAKRANLEAAIMCNHKRTPPKTWEASLHKKEEAVDKLRAAKPDLGKYDEQIKARSIALAKLKEQRTKFEAEAPDRVRKAQEALARLDSQTAPTEEKARREWDKKFKAKEKALRKVEKENAAKARSLKERLRQAQTAVDKAREARTHAAESYRERLGKAARQCELAKLTRDYNLNTSLKNYIDPRVYRDWGERVGYVWTRLYPTTLQRKFAWVDEGEDDEESSTAPNAEADTGAAQPEAEAERLATMTGPDGQTPETEMETQSAGE